MKLLLLLLVDTLTYFEITNQYGSMSVLLISFVYVLFVAFVFLPPQAKFLMIAADYDFVITEQELRERKKQFEQIHTNYGTRVQSIPSITSNSRPPSEPVYIGDSTNAGLGNITGGKSEIVVNNNPRNSVQLEEKEKKEKENKEKETKPNDIQTNSSLPSETTTTQTMTTKSSETSSKTEIKQNDSKQQQQQQQSKAWSTYQDILSDDKKPLPPTITPLQNPHQRSNSMLVVSSTSHNKESNTTTNSIARPPTNVQRSITLSSVDNKNNNNNNNNNSPQISDRTGLLSGREKDVNQTSARRRTGAFISNAASTFLEGLQKRMRAPVTKVFCLETAAW